MGLRSQCVAVACMFAFAGQAADAATQTFALMSLVGTQVTVATFRPSVGSNLASNAFDRFPVNDAHFDRQAVRAIAAAIAARDADAKTLPLSAGDAAWVASAREAVLNGTAVEDVAAPVLEAAKPAGATHLLLVLPARSDLRFQFVGRTIGTGRADGLGLYVDRGLLTRRSDSGEVGRGFLGVFAFVRLVLIDAGSGRVVADRTADATSVYSAARAQDADPLHALTPAQQAQMLERLLAKAIGDELPALLEAARR